MKLMELALGAGALVGLGWAYEHGKLPSLSGLLSGVAPKTDFVPPPGSAPSGNPTPGRSGIAAGSRLSNGVTVSGRCGGWGVEVDALACTWGVSRACVAWFQHDMNRLPNTPGELDGYKQSSGHVGNCE